MSRDITFVPKGGVEPPRPLGRPSLSRLRLPFRHLGLVLFEELPTYHSAIRVALLSPSLLDERIVS